MENPQSKIIQDIDKLYLEDDDYLDKIDTKDISSKANAVDQFNFITHFPNFRLSYISDSFQILLGYDQLDLSIKSLLNLIHPNDLSVVGSSYKNACEFILNNYSFLPVGTNIFTFNYRLRNKSGEYLKFSVANQLHEKLNWNNGFKLLSKCSLLNSFPNNLPIKKSGKKNWFILNDELNHSFTQREMQILKLLASGKNSLEIGSILKISKHTVDTHRRKMLAKSHFSNTAELIANCVSLGLMD